MISAKPAHLSDQSHQQLLEIASASIDYGLANQRPLEVVPEAYASELQAKQASFVTLKKAGELRGCIGHLEAIQPLVSDVADNAFSSAFRDPRFPPLTAVERDHLQIHISVLTPAKPLSFESEEDLIKKIRPGIDGLILIEGLRRGTFLPSVWGVVPDPADFLRQLKIKASLPPDYWSNTIEIMHYETESFSDRP
jgi:AmmeMemoRadiSam system protein A